MDLNVDALRSRSRNVVASRVLYGEICVDFRFFTATRGHRMNEMEGYVHKNPRIYSVHGYIAKNDVGRLYEALH